MDLDGNWQPETRGTRGASPWTTPYDAARAEFEREAAYQRSGRGAPQRAYDSAIPWQQWSEQTAFTPSYGVPHGTHGAFAGNAQFAPGSFGPNGSDPSTSQGWSGQQPYGAPQQALGFPGPSAPWNAYGAPQGGFQPQGPYGPAQNVSMSPGSPHYDPSAGPGTPWSGPSTHFVAPQGYAAPRFGPQGPGSWQGGQFATEPGFAATSYPTVPSGFAPRTTWSSMSASRIARADRPFVGVPPKGYVRSDTRIREDVCDALMEDGVIDVRDVEITVASGEVTLTGTVADRWSKRQLEQIVESCLGVRDVRNNLRVPRSDETADEANASRTSARSSQTQGTAGRSR
jgi:hypothetical protein